jgi:hypothetical protein
MLGASEVL